MPTDADFTAIHTELAPLLPMLGQAAQTVLDEDVSNYPVFLIFKGESVGVGLPVVPASNDGWTVHISTLEELVTRRIIEQTKVDDFRKLYKSKVGHLCLLVWQQDSAQIIFLPQPEE